ncbi:MAG: class GN sortase [Myxococcota bacterium]
MSATVLPVVRPVVSVATARRLLVVTAVLLTTAGGVLTARALYLRAKAALAAHLIARAWEDTLRTGVNTPPWPWADTHPIGRLIIPRIGYNEVILEGASGRNMAFGPAHMMDSEPLGAPGNMVVAGHRTSWFLPLKDVAVDDDIQLQWRNAATGALTQRVYRVTEIHVIDPADLTYITPATTEYLTLMTCYPFGHQPHSPRRYVVRAVPVPEGRG